MTVVKILEQKKSRTEFSYNLVIFHKARVPELEVISLIQIARALFNKILHPNLLSKKCTLTNWEVSAQGI